MTKEEFVQIWKELLPGLRSFCLTLTSYNKEDAEDLVQETYIKAQVGLSTYEKDFSAKTWVYSIAKNKFKDDYRRKKRRSAINNSMSAIEFDNSDSSDVDSTNFNNVVREMATDSNLGIGNFIIDDILKAIDTLDEKEKIPFTMYVEGYQYDEIAEKCQQPLGTVKVRIFTARRKLWEQLKEYSDINCKFKR